MEALREGVWTIFAGFRAAHAATPCVLLPAIARAVGDIRHSRDREAITEHAQWLNLRRARPFELHIEYA